MKRILFATIGLLSLVVADEKEMLFEQTNHSYESGDYPQAIQLYEKILEGGAESSELYYNLGNAYFKNKQVGKAILNYERAKKITPGDEDLKTNLQIANLSIPDKITSIPRLFIWDWLNDIRNFFGINLLAVLSLSGWIFGTTAFSYWIWTKSRRSKQISIVTGSIFILIFSLFLWAVYSDQQVVEGIVQDPQIAVYSAPDGNSTELFFLHEGVKLEIQGQAGEWTKIHLADGKVGWLKKSSVEII